MCAGIGHLTSRAYFISPIVNMEKLIADMMQWANVTEAELRSKGVIHTAFGEHWFHTEEQMRFLDDWIRSCEGENLCSHLERGTHGNGTADPRFNPGIG